MATSVHHLADLRFGDIQTFLAVRRWASITAAARDLHVTPSQVSKAVARLEKQLGAQLLSRGARGVALSPVGLRLLPQLEELARGLAILRASESGPKLTIAAPAFLNALFLPAIAQCRPAVRMRAIELPPALVRIYAAENVFDMALCLGAEAFPPNWVSVRIGDMRKALFASPELARRLGLSSGTIVSPHKVRDVPFIVPIYNHNGQFLVADEGCPLGAERCLGHEVQTLAIAFELAVCTDQLVFGPVAAARPYVERGALIEVCVEGWDVNEELFLVCNGTRMRARDQKELALSVRDRLSELST